MDPKVKAEIEALFEVARKQIEKSKGWDGVTQRYEWPKRKPRKPWAELKAEIEAQFDELQGLIDQLKEPVPTWSPFTPQEKTEAAESTEIKRDVDAQGKVADTHESTSTAPEVMSSLSSTADAVAEDREITVPSTEDMTAQHGSGMKPATEQPQHPEDTQPREKSVADLVLFYKARAKEMHDGE